MKTVKNISISQLAKEYNVQPKFIHTLLYEGKSDDEVISHLEKISKPQYRLNRLFVKYVQVYLKKILLYFDEPEQRKLLKQEYFNEWHKNGLPITNERLEMGWSRIVKGAYNDAI